MPTTFDEVEYGGKVAVHCHFYSGSLFDIFSNWNGDCCYAHVCKQAVGRVQSVQSSDQVETLNAFECLLRVGGGDVIPQEKCRSCSEYVGYSSRFLAKSDLRLYGRVPCVIYVGVRTVLNLSYETVEITFRPEETGAKIFLVKCQHPIHRPYDAEDASLRLARGPLVAQKEYNKMIEDGCSLINLHSFLHSMDIVSVLRFLHFFVSTAFYQLTTAKQAQKFLAGADEPSSVDWGQSLALLCWLCARLPAELLAPVSRLVSDAFIHSTELTDSVRRVARELSSF